MKDDHTADVARAEAAARAEASEPEVTRGLRLLGSEHESRPDWQERVFGRIKAEAKQARRDMIEDYIKGALTGLAIAAVSALIVAYLAGWL